MYLKVGRQGRKVKSFLKGRKMAKKMGDR